MVIILYMVNDIKEDQGHFIMFHRMLNNLDALLLEEIVKCFHYELKGGILKDRIKGYAIGKYLANINITTSLIIFLKHCTSFI